MLLYTDRNLDGALDEEPGDCFAGEFGMMIDLGSCKELHSEWFADDEATDLGAIDGFNLEP